MLRYGQLITITDKNGTVRGSVDVAVTHHVAAAKLTCAQPLRWHHDATLKANVCESPVPTSTPTPRPK